MSTTLAQLRTRTRQKLGLQANDGMLTDSSLTTTINNALDKMAVEYNWPWLIAHESFNTVVAQNQYDPPADWIKTRWLKINDYDLDSRQRVDLIQYDLTSGMPTSFAIDEQKIWLSPAPDAVYSVVHSYMTTENNLTADGDTVKCPDQYSDVIVTYAAIIEARRMNNSSVEQQMLDDKKEWLRNIAKLVPQVDILPRIRVGRDWPRGW